MSSAQSKRQKLAAECGGGGGGGDVKQEEQVKVGAEANNFGVDVDDLTDDTDSETDEEELDEEAQSGAEKCATSANNHLDIQEQLAAAGPAGVAAAAAIATARKRKRPHSFETNPSVRKRQQTRLIRKLRASIDEYTMRVGQQAVVLITMPGKAVHNFKVFGAQPLESVIRACKHEIMGELEQALLEQAPLQFKEDASKHELPALVIDGIPTPVEKMTQAQLRAFIPLMLKYSTGRGKPGWGKESTRPAWWPETLPWANVRSDARDECEKQRISWTTTLRQIVTNCYKFHGRDDLLPSFDDSDEAAAAGAAALKHELEVGVAASRRHRPAGPPKDQAEQQQQQQQQQSYQAHGYASNFVHTITNPDGSVSLIQVDPANAQILTLPDGTQVRAVRLQTLGAESLCASGANQPGAQQQQLAELHEAHQLELAAGQQQGGVALTEAQLAADGQIIVTGEDGVQNCYPMSSLVSIPASVYQQFAAGGQQLSIVSADGQTISGGALTIHALHEQPAGEQQQQQQQVSGSQEQQQQDELKIHQIEGQSEEAQDRTETQLD